MIPRGYKNSGNIDFAVCNSINSAAKAGISKRDTYMTPCATSSCKSADSQMSDLVDYLKKNCNTNWSKRIWIDIGDSKIWTSSTSNNQKFYKALIDSCKKNNVSCGVYSSRSQWISIFGSATYCYGQNLPLWYLHYDNNPSFSDYGSSSFGCWTSPHAKRFAGGVSTCSMTVNKNFSPSF